MKNLILFFLLMTISIFGSNERYEVGIGKTQIGLNFGINQLIYDDEGATGFSILDSKFFPLESSLNIGPKLGRFHTEGGGLNLTFGITEDINISISSPISSIYFDNDDSDNYYLRKGGSTTLSLDYTIKLTESLTIIINPFLSKTLYYKAETKNRTQDLAENTPTIDYGANIILLFEQDNLFGDFVIGYHRNEEKSGSEEYDEWEEEYYSSTNYPETSQTTFAGYFGKILDEESRIKAGFIFHKLKVSNDYRSQSVDFTKLEGVYTKKISNSTTIDIALSYTTCDDLEKLNIFGLNAKITTFF